PHGHFPLPEQSEPTRGGRRISADLPLLVYEVGRAAGLEGRSAGGELHPPLGGRSRAAALERAIQISPAPLHESKQNGRPPPKTDRFGRLHEFSRQWPRARRASVSIQRENGALRKTPHRTPHRVAFLFALGF